MKSKAIKKNSRRNNEYILHLMLLPAALVVFVYCYIPMFGVVLAFEQFNPALGIFKSEFVGLENFKYIFGSQDFKRALFNTIFIAMMKIIAGLAVPVTFAILLNEIKKTFAKRILQTVVYLPHFISWVLMSGIIIDLLSPGYGIVNEFLKVFGIEPIFFLADNNWFPFIMVITDVWKNFGWGTIIFLAALTSINPLLYEAAIMDGAGRWKQTLYITLPGIKPVFILVATLSLGNVLNAGFEQIFNLVSPVTYESGDIIDTLVYRMAFLNAEFGIATAAGLFKSIVSFIMITLSYRLAFKYAGYRIF